VDKITKLRRGHGAWIAKAVDAALDKSYNSDQERDDHGRWTTGGGAGSEAHPSLAIPGQSGKPIISRVERYSPGRDGNLSAVVVSHGSETHEWKKQDWTGSGKPTWNRTEWPIAGQVPNWNVIQATPEQGAALTAHYKAGKP
jgi:hypothetical protein